MQLFRKRFSRVYDSGSRRGLEPCSASSILATLTSFAREVLVGGMPPL